MGTRADFYVGRGKNAEWLGSTAWDGYPSGFADTGILEAATEAEYREKVITEIAGREDGTKPENGWPWPWETSHTTDYAYAFDDGKVYASCFGRPWFDARHEPEDDDEDQPRGDAPEFPNMKDRQKVTLGKRSGVMVFGG
jgi:hypothetical protein